MRISIDMLLKRMPFRDCDCFLKSSDGRDYSCAAIFSKEIFEREEGIIYVCSAAALDQIPFLPQHISIICVGMPKRMQSYQNEPVNIIIINGEYSVNCVLIEAQKCFMYYETWSEKLNKAIIDRATMQTLVNLTESVIGYPLAVIDSAFGVLAATKYSNTNDIAWQEFQTSYLQKDTMSKDSVRASRMNESIKPVQVFSSLSKRYVMSQAIRVNHHIVGYASAHRPRQNDEKFSKAEETILDIFTQAVARRMELDDFFSNVTEKSFSHLLLNILDKQMVDEMVIKERADYIGAELRGKKQIIVIGLPQGFSPKKVQEQIQVLWPQFTCIVYQGAFVLFGAQLTQDFRIDADKVRELFSEKIKIGVSIPFYQVRQIYDGYIQARKAVQFGEMYQKEEICYHYENYLMAHACECMINMVGDPTAFLHPYIERLSHVEEGYGNTLWVYLENNKNVLQSAKKLFVHRNTIVYRLNMIQELLQSDFSDEKEIQNLLFSFALQDHIRRMAED